MPRCPGGARAFLLAALDGLRAVGSTVTPCNSREGIRYRSGNRDQLQPTRRRQGRPYSFRVEKPAIARSHSMRTPAARLCSPHLRRVTRCLPRSADELKRGDPLFEIDSPEVGQPTPTDRCGPGVEKASHSLSRQRHSSATAGCSQTNHLAARSRPGAKRLRRAHQTFKRRKFSGRRRNRCASSVRDQAEVTGWSANASSIR